MLRSTVLVALMSSARAWALEPGTLQVTIVDPDELPLSGASLGLTLDPSTIAKLFPDSPSPCIGYFALVHGFEPDPASLASLAPSQAQFIGAWACNRWFWAAESARRRTWRSFALDLNPARPTLSVGVGGLMRVMALSVELGAWGAEGPADLVCRSGCQAFGLRAGDVAVRLWPHGVGFRTEWVGVRPRTPSLQLQANYGDGY